MKNQFKIGETIKASIPISGGRGKRIEIKGKIKSINGKVRPLYTIVDGEVQQEFVVYKISKK